MNNLKKIVAIIAGAMILAIQSITGTTPVMAAVVDNGLFELEGNAADDTSAGTPDDLAKLYTGGGSAVYFSGSNIDPAVEPEIVFTGDNKDIQNISQLGWIESISLEKSDITDAYATAYNAAGELIMYFGVDRLAISGDAFLGLCFIYQTKRPRRFFTANIPMVTSWCWSIFPRLEMRSDDPGHPFHSVPATDPISFRPKIPVRPKSND